MKFETHRSFPSELQSLVAAANAQLSASHAVERLWARDHRLWKQDPTDITNRLGWLTIIEYMKDRTEELRTFAASAQKRGIRDVVLLDRSRRRSTRLEACSSSPANPVEPSKSCPSLPTFGNVFTRPRATKVANSSSPLPIPAPGWKNWQQSISSGASLPTHRTSVDGTRSSPILD